MIHIGVQLKDWLEKTGLKVRSYHCPKCKKDFEINIPAVTKEAYALVSEIHECGKGYVGACMTPRTKNGIEFFKSIFGGDK